MTERADLKRSIVDALVQSGLAGSAGDMTECQAHEVAEVAARIAWPLSREVARLEEDIEGWRQKVEGLHATLETARNTAVEDIRLLAAKDAEIARWKTAWQEADREWAKDQRALKEAMSELDLLRHAVESLRDAHHIPYVDEDHQGGNCADIVLGMIAARIKTESSRRDWAAEAARLQAELDDYTQPAVWDEPHAFKDSGYGDPEIGIPGNCDTCGQFRDEPVHDPPFGPLRLRAAANAPCSCISDDQATHLGPRFSRPVCAVHPEVSDA